MPEKKSPWSNPYKTLSWLNRVNSRQFSKLDINLWDYIACWGKNGCNDRNYKLVRELHYSKRSIQRSIHKLERHRLIIVIPGWSDLEYGRFKKLLRDRRLIALPWPTKADWMRESISWQLRDFGGSAEKTDRPPVPNLAPFERRT